MISSLDLKDFKCFESFENPICFSQINLLTGSNGRGKSSIFQSMLLLGQSFRSGKTIDCLKLNGRNVKLGTYYDVLRKGSKTGRFSILLSSDDADENKAYFTFKPNEHNHRIAYLDSLKISYANGSEKELVSSVGGDNSNSHEEAFVTTSTSAIKVINQLLNVYYISADRQGPVNYVNFDDNNDGSVGIRGEYVIHTLKKKEKEILHKTVGVISFIMGGASMSVKDIDTEYIKVLIDSSDNNEGYKPVNVGFGYSYILPVIVLPLVVSEGSKVFIENPEAHLHPGAQSRLMDFLISIAKEKNLQLFIETHSDHLVNALRIATKKKLHGIDYHDSAIIHVNRDELGKALCCQIKMDQEGNLSDYPQDFMDEWTKQMLDLV